jgi:ElaA protein
MSLVIRQAPYPSPAFQTCFDIRLTVFVGEQNVPLEDERDEFDAVGKHFLAEFAGAPAGTARLLMKDAGIAKITRVAVLPEFRRHGIGGALMRHAQAHIPPGTERIFLDAQRQAAAFYERLGFAATGAPFMEGGIAHQRMEKVIISPPK